MRPEFLNGAVRPLGRRERSLRPGGRRQDETEHEPDTGERHFGGEPREAGAGHGAGAGKSELLIDDDDLLVRPRSRALLAMSYCRSLDSTLCSTWAALD
jgi:hypothetical protein